MMEERYVIAEAKKRKKILEECTRLTRIGKPAEDVLEWGSFIRGGEDQHVKEIRDKVIDQHELDEVERDSEKEPYGMDIFCKCLSVTLCVDESYLQHNDFDNFSAEQFEQVLATVRKFPDRQLLEPVMAKLLLVSNFAIRGGSIQVDKVAVDATEAVMCVKIDLEQERFLCVCKVAGRDLHEMQYIDKLNCDFVRHVIERYGLILAEGSVLAVGLRPWQYYGSCTLADYDVKEDDVLFLVLRLRGSGGFATSNEPIRSRLSNSAPVFAFVLLSSVCLIGTAATCFVLFVAYLLSILAFGADRIRSGCFESPLSFSPFLLVEYFSAWWYGEQVVDADWQNWNANLLSEQLKDEPKAYSVKKGMIKMKPRHSESPIETGSYVELSFGPVAVGTQFSFRRLTKKLKAALSSGKHYKTYEELSLNEKQVIMRDFRLRQVQISQVEEDDGPMDIRCYAMGAGIPNANCLRVSLSAGERVRDTNELRIVGPVLIHGKELKGQMCKIVDEKNTYLWWIGDAYAAIAEGSTESGTFVWHVLKKYVRVEGCIRTQTLGPDEAVGMRIEQ